MAKQIPTYTGTLRNHSLTIPSCVSECSGIRIFGRRIKSLAFTTDVAIIKNINSDAIIAVYPFTPQPVISQAIISVSDVPVFVGVGGVDGLLHVSEMAWYRVNHPSDLLKEGDELDVYILGIDQENEKISLGLKQLVPNPWSLVEEKYPVGSIITAKVMRTTTFGAFLEVEPGVEGLVHISQLAHHRVEKTEDVVKPGDIVKVKVLAIDPEAKRMSLSIKAAVEPEENEVTTEHIDTTEE